jgi:hypothetical protein
MSVESKAIDSTIRDLVARSSARHPELRSRLERAAMITLFRDVRLELDGSWSVGSECDPTKAYRVDARLTPACTCQDAQRHPGDFCKHDLAVGLLLWSTLGCRSLGQGPRRRVRASADPQQREQRLEAVRRQRLSRAKGGDRRSRPE